MLNPRKVPTRKCSKTLNLIKKNQNFKTTKNPIFKTTKREKEAIHTTMNRIRPAKL